MTSAISVERLSKSYGRITALTSASLEVPRGQIFGLVGPNGAGKSTIIKAICGILKPDSGSVSVLGLKAAGERFAVRGRLGYMPQAPSLYEDLSAWENLVFFGRAMHPADLKEKVRRALEFVELWERRNDPLHTFSGGMRQRASLACAMTHDPELLVLDEPTAGVDPKLRQSFWHRFEELKAAGRSIFITTNQMDEAIRCDQVAVIRGGRILVSEAPGRIISEGRTRIDIELKNGSRSETVAGYEQDLPRLLGQYGLSDEVKRISINRPSLEEVILDMIEEQE